VPTERLNCLWHPPRFELVINVNLAKGHGLTVPSLLPA